MYDFSRFTSRHGRNSEKKNITRCATEGDGDAVFSLYYTVCYHGSAIVFLKAAQITKVKLSYNRSSPHSPTRFTMYFSWNTSL